MTDPTRKKAKKGRVNSEYAELDEITDPPGEEYVHWSRLTKDKLKDRERKLMSLRMSSLRTIIVQQCQHFADINSPHHHNVQRVTVSHSEHVIGDDITSECLNKLYLLLQFWSGVNLTKTKKPLNSFRDYFMIAKSWFDQKKKNMLGPDLWIPVFRALARFSTTAAATYFSERFPALQRLYAKHLLLQIMGGILDGQITFAERKQPLIPTAIFKESQPIQEHLVQIDAALDIKRFIEVHVPRRQCVRFCLNGNESTVYVPWTLSFSHTLFMAHFAVIIPLFSMWFEQQQKSVAQSNKPVNAASIHQFVCHSVMELTDAAYQHFQSEFNALWDDINPVDINPVNGQNGDRTRNHVEGALIPMTTNQVHVHQTPHNVQPTNSSVAVPVISGHGPPPNLMAESNSFGSNATNASKHSNQSNQSIPSNTSSNSECSAASCCISSGYFRDKPQSSFSTPISREIPVPIDLNLNPTPFSKRYGASRSTVSSVFGARFNPMSHGLNALNHRIAVPSWTSTTEMTQITRNTNNSICPPSCDCQVSAANDGDAQSGHCHIAPSIPSIPAIGSIGAIGDFACFQQEMSVDPLLRFDALSGSGGSHDDTHPLQCSCQLTPYR